MITSNEINDFDRFINLPNTLSNLQEMKAHLDSRIEILQQKQTTKKKLDNKPTIARLRKKLSQLNEQHVTFTGSTSADFLIQFKLSIQVDTNDLQDCVDSADCVGADYPDVNDLFFISITPTVTGTYSDATLIHDATFDAFDALGNASGLKIIAPELYNKLEVFTTKVATFIEDARKHEITLFDLTEDDGE